MNKTFEYPEINTKRKTGNELLLGNDQKKICTLFSFWQWAHSDLISNTERGVFAEWIVANAVGVADNVRVEWDKFDLITPEGISLEIKSSGYIQTWNQDKLSNILFGIRPTQGWDKETNSYESEIKRQADVYVFCVQSHKEQTTVNPLNLSQWDFYVLNTSILNENVKNQKSISLSGIIKLGAVICDYNSLYNTIKMEYKR